MGGGIRECLPNGKRATRSCLNGLPDDPLQLQTLIDALDDGCLLRIFARLSPMPGMLSKAL